MRTGGTAVDASRRRRVGSLFHARTVTCRAGRRPARGHPVGGQVHTDSGHRAAPAVPRTVDAASASTGPGRRPRRWGACRGAARRAVRTGVPGGAQRPPDGSPLCPQRCPQAVGTGVDGPPADPSVAVDEAPGHHAGRHRVKADRGAPGGLARCRAPRRRGLWTTPRNAPRWHPAAVTESPHPLLPAATPVLRLDADVLQVGGVDGGAGLRISPADAGARGPAAAAGRPAQPAARCAPTPWPADWPGRRGRRPARRAARRGPARSTSTAADLLAADAGPAAAARAGAELPAAAGVRRRRSLAAPAGRARSSSRARTGWAPRWPRCWPPAGSAGCTSATRGRPPPGTRSSAG